MGFNDCQIAPIAVQQAPKLQSGFTKSRGCDFLMKLLLISAITVFWLFSAQTGLTEELTGKVASVSDGDTLRVLVGDQQIKIRLGGIDAPESDKPFGQSSKR